MSWDSESASKVDAANKSEWPNITRPEALAARAASRFPAQVAAAQRPSDSESESDVTKGEPCTIRITRSWRLRVGNVGNMQTCQ